MSRRGAWIRLSTRLAIYFRDGFRCVYCRADAADGITLTLDHIVRGSNEPKNLLTACEPCNSARGGKSLSAWYEALREKGIATKPVRLRIHRARHRALNADLGLLASRVLEHVAVERLAMLWPRTRRTK